MTRVFMLLPAIITLFAFINTTNAAPPASSNATESNPGMSKKRAEPARVAPVIIGNVQFEVVPWGKERGYKQDSGIIRARDTKTGAEIWLLKLYDITIDPTMEQDKQEDFIVQIMPFQGKLLAITEHRLRYLVDLKTRTVVRQKTK